MKVLLTGGGTAGHTIPALNIGKELKEKFREVELTYAGNDNFIEKKLAEKEQLPFIHIESKGFEGSSKKEKYIDFIRKNLAGYKQALSYMKDSEIDLVIATGGFATFPVLCAARKLSIPYFIHEQNKVLGKVNRLFHKKAERLYYSFTNTERSKVVPSEVFGNPVNITNRIDEGRKDGDLVVLGGSGGSRYLNEWALRYAKENPEVNIHLQVGVKNEKQFKDIIKEENIDNINVYGYVDVAQLLKKARMVVSRAGSGTLFELYNAGIPTVIVPLPNSADDHQYKNAKEFESMTNRMKVIRQTDEAYLSEEVTSWYRILGNINVKANFGEKSFRNSAKNIALDIYNVHHNKYKSKRSR